MQSNRKSAFNDRDKDIVAQLNLSSSGKDRALAYYQAGEIYQGREKYEEAIANYQESRKLYEQLGREQDVVKLV